MTFTNKKDSPDTFDPALHVIGTGFPIDARAQVISVKHRYNANLMSWVKLKDEAAEQFKKSAEKQLEVQAAIRDLNGEIQLLLKKKHAALRQVESLVSPQCSVPKKTRQRTAPTKSN